MQRLDSFTKPCTVVHLIQHHRVSRLRLQSMASGLLKSILLEEQSSFNNGKESSTRLFALKDSRWFTHEESNLFENVLESGYILELRIANVGESQIIRKDRGTTLEFGIMLWMNEPDGEKKQAVVIHLVGPRKERRKSGREIRYSTLNSFWMNGTEIRINNMDEHKAKSDSLSIITDRISRASRSFYKWNDSYSFVHWCRYGTPVPVEGSSKKKQLQQAAVRWGSISASAGALFYVSRHQRPRHNPNQNA